GRPPRHPGGPLPSRPGLRAVRSRPGPAARWLRGPLPGGQPAGPPRGRPARLLPRQHESLERQAHATLISAILAQAHTHPEEAAIRVRALGVPVTGRNLITAVIRFRTSGSGLSAQAQVLEVAEAMADACRGEHIPALVGSIGEGRAAALLSLDHEADPDSVLAAVCATARQRFRRRARQMAGAAEADPVIGVGSAATS